MIEQRLDLINVTKPHHHWTVTFTLVVCVSPEGPVARICTG